MKSEWISVKDRLPELKRRFVLVYLPQYKNKALSYIDNDGNWAEVQPYCFGEITHWMPLPEPPDEI